MGGIISDLLEETCDLERPPLKIRPRNHGSPRFDEDDVEEALEDGVSRTNDRGSRRRSRAKVPCNNRSHHKLCRQGTTRASKATRRMRRPLSYSERLERLCALEDPTMVERSSTPTAILCSENACQDEEEEYCAWTSYLHTPGTFRGQMKPNLPGAFSGMCFPQSDPRWIQSNVPVAVKSIIN